MAMFPIIYRTSIGMNITANLELVSRGDMIDAWYFGCGCLNELNTASNALRCFVIPKCVICPNELQSH